MNYIYILNCEKDKLYTGYTTEIDRRWKEHREGSPKSKFTKAFKPRSIACVWQTSQDKGYAQKIEYYIKTLSKKEKLQLIENPEILIQKYDNLSHCSYR
jgi:putative endonuclease